MKDINIYKNIEKNLTNVFVNDGYDNVNIIMEKGSNDGDGYVALVVRALVTGEKDGKKYSVDIIVKCANNAPDARKFLSMTQMFHREVFFYTNIISCYKKIQDENCIPDHLKCDFINYICSSNKYLEEYVAMENMKTKGYLLSDRADYQHTEKAFQMLGKFHGLSMIFEKMHKKDFDKSTAIYDNVLQFIDFDEYDSSGIKNYMEKSATRFINSIENEKHRKMLSKAIGNSVCEKYVQLTSRSKKKVIGHGDFWLNNMFFKYQNNEPVQAIPVDFQLARYESPMNDFLTFIGASSEADLRRNHFWDLFDVYYDSLKAFVAACGYDVDEFYSYEDMKMELHDQAVFVFCVGILLIPFFTCYEDERLDLSLLFNGKYPKSFLNENKIFKKRVNDLVTDFVNFGLLK